MTLTGGNMCVGCNVVCERAGMRAAKDTQPTADTGMLLGLGEKGVMEPSKGFFSSGV